MNTNGTRHSAGSALTLRMNSNPLPPGMPTSEMMSAGGSVRARDNASATLAAVTTRNPCGSSSCRFRSRFIALSSTTSTVQRSSTADRPGGAPAVRCPSGRKLSTIAMTCWGSIGLEM